MVAFPPCVSATTTKRRTKPFPFTGIFSLAFVSVSHRVGEVGRVPSDKIDQAEF